MKHTLVWLLLLSAPVWAQLPDLRALGVKAAQLRGLSYTPVQSQVVSQRECAAYLLKLLDQELEPRRTRMKECFLKALGLMPAKASMKTILAELYTDQVRGLYDPAKKRYLVVQESGGKGGGSKEEAQAAQMAAALGLSTTDVLAVHELGHAIQDQHFNLSQIEHAVATDSDHEFAAQALIEGDASVLMMDYAMGVIIAKTGIKAPGLDPGALAGMDPSSMAMGDSQALARAPRYFREALTLPYSQGMVFVAELRKHGGWKAVDRAFTNLPPSSEDIFHPDLYLSGRGQPKPVSLAGLPAQVGKYDALGDDTAGAFTVRVLEEENGLRGVADGWGADHYRVYATAFEQFAVWATVWNSEREARAFEALVQKALTARWGTAQPDGTASVWTRQGSLCRMEEKGTHVNLWLGVPQELIKELPL